MQQDPIQPFREAFDRCIVAYAQKELALIIERLRMFDLDWLASKVGQDASGRPSYQQQVYVAARSLQIAETEGVDAALMWKLSN